MFIKSLESENPEGAVLPKVRSKQQAYAAWLSWTFTNFFEHSDWALLST